VAMKTTWVIPSTIIFFLKTHCGGSSHVCEFSNENRGVKDFCELSCRLGDRAGWQDGCDGCGEGGLGQLVERRVVSQLEDTGGRGGGLSLQQMVVVQLEVRWWTGGIEDRIVI
jgi:hypothetical protein